MGYNPNRISLTLLRPTFEPSGEASTLKIPKSNPMSTIKLASSPSRLAPRSSLCGIQTASSCRLASPEKTIARRSSDFNKRLADKGIKNIRWGCYCIQFPWVFWRPPLGKRWWILCRLRFRYTPRSLHLEGVPWSLRWGSPFLLRSAWSGRKRFVYRDRSSLWYWRFHRWVL